jgi:hypothetical protein
VAGLPVIVTSVITAVALLGWLEGARAAYRRAVDHGPPRVRENAARALQILDDPPVGE